MKKIYSSIVATLLLSFIGFNSFAQETTALPNYLTDAEKELIGNFEFRSTRVTPPPTSEVRAMAEWEEIEYVVITWEPSFPNILRQIVAAAVEECKVIIVTQNETSVSNYLSANGIDLTNIEFLNVNWDTIWIRDYGGNTVYSDDVGERALVDWIYNRPRPNDDVIPSAHANMQGLPIYITDSGTNDLVNTGGNYMSDGLGTAFASELVLSENAVGNPYGVTPKTEAEIDAIMNAYMGIDTYIKMTPLPYDIISHIDMHMKLLDEETLLISEYPEGVADGPQIELNIEYIQNNFQSAFGTPYKILRIDAPPSASGLYPDNGGYYRNYTNALFINKTILVPTYRPEVDVPALAQWEEMMPGYTIVGIDVDNPGENLISLVGAIHCITHQIGVEDPLWIVHQPIAEANAGSTVDVTAMIKHISGVQDATVHWREVGAPSFSQLAMSPAGDDNWTTNMSIPTDAVEIEYYIEAEANSGKSIVRPIVAPEGNWSFDVAALSVDDWAIQNISSAYPNPTRDQVNFDLNNIDGNISISIHNVLGQELRTMEIERGDGIITLDLNPNWRGTLFVTFEGDFGRVSKRIIKL